MDKFIYRYDETSISALPAFLLTLAGCGIIMSALGFVIGYLTYEIFDFASGMLFGMIFGVVGAAFCGLYVPVAKRFLKARYSIYRAFSKSRTIMLLFYVLWTYMFVTFGAPILGENLGLTLRHSIFLRVLIPMIISALNILFSLWLGYKIHEVYFLTRFGKSSELRIKTFLGALQFVLILIVLFGSLTVIFGTFIWDSRMNSTLDTCFSKNLKTYSIYCDHIDSDKPNHARFVYVTLDDAEIAFESPYQQISPYPGYRQGSWKVAEGNRTQVNAALDSVRAGLARIKDR